MNIYIELLNPKVCFNCVCECQDEGRDYCSMGYWDWASRTIAWYDEDNDHIVVDESDPTKYDPGWGPAGMRSVYLETTERPDVCPKEHGL